MDKKKKKKERNTKVRYKLQNQSLTWKLFK
jgi:hypothetical protein